MSNNASIATQLIDVNETEQAKPISQALAPQAIHLFATKATSVKKDIDMASAEIMQRQDKMRFVNSIIADFNFLTDEANTLNLEGQTELLEKLRVAREDLGIKFPDSKLKLHTLERDRFIENLHIGVDGWDKENKTQTQKIDILMKNLDSLITILKSVEKTEDRSIQSHAKAARGA